LACLRQTLLARPPAVGWMSISAMLHASSRGPRCVWGMETRIPLTTGPGSTCAPRSLALARAVSLLLLPGRACDLQSPHESRRWSSILLFDFRKGKEKRKGVPAYVCLYVCECLCARLCLCTREAVSSLSLSLARALSLALSLCRTFSVRTRRRHETKKIRQPKP
jgi:hypothetical protein